MRAPAPPAVQPVVVAEEPVGVVHGAADTARVTVAEANGVTVVETVVHVSVIESVAVRSNTPEGKNAVVNGAVASIETALKEAVAVVVPAAATEAVQPPMVTPAGRFWNKNLTCVD